MQHGIKIPQQAPGEINVTGIRFKRISQGSYGHPLGATVNNNKKPCARVITRDFKVDILPIMFQNIHVPNRGVSKTPYSSRVTHIIHNKRFIKAHLVPNLFSPSSTYMGF
ncbi:uncharacterized protein DS421_1g03280 [Arachis hypogaea]|nr:uncharacterized protein DS421_1g03280 [Arachis hypogaea]